MLKLFALRFYSDSGIFCIAVRWADDSVFWRSCSLADALSWFGEFTPTSVPEQSMLGGVVSCSLVGALPCIGIAIRLLRVYCSRDEFFFKDSSDAWLLTC